MIGTGVGTGIGTVLGMGQDTGMGAQVRAGLGTGMGGIVRGRQGGVAGGKAGRRLSSNHQLARAREGSLRYYRWSTAVRSRELLEPFRTHRGWP